MNCRSDILLTLAGPEDSAGIKAVFDSMSFSGGISVRYARDPDPLNSMELDGERAVVVVFRDLGEAGRIVGVGGCIVREEYVHGALCKIGYLTGMKLLPEYQGKALPIAAAYRLIRQSTPEVSVYYTTILRENTAAQKLLEKRRRSMPVYVCHGFYRVYCIGGRRSTSSVKSTYVVERNRMDGLKAFYEQTLCRADFACPLDFFLKQEHCDFFTLRDVNQSILAVCAVWNQQHYKQYIIQRYGGAYSLLRRLPLHLLGYPRFPSPGSPANYASIALLRTIEGRSDMAQTLLRAVAAQTRYDLLFAGLPSNSPYLPALEKIPHISYESKFYTVHFDGNAPAEHPYFSPEVGLL